jgi:tryptophan 2,3-dioxygenase
MEFKPVYYSEYLQLDKILNAQEPVSFQYEGMKAHDEMLFVVIHQAYELWFKQILFETQSVIDILSQPKINDNGPELHMMVHRLQRVAIILDVLVHQMDIMESMTSLDFLDFRDMLRPASGFQSVQFKILEAKLGLQYDKRHGQAYYLSQLKPEDVELIKSAEGTPNLLQLINEWLERFPLWKDKNVWGTDAVGEDHPFWQSYYDAYSSGLQEGEKQNTSLFRSILFEENQERALSPKASRTALFIYAYRGYPMLELPFQLLDTLIKIDAQMGLWRSRHMNMVRRMIGSRTGTGGSTGAGYLQGAMEKHYIFKELAQLNSLLIERRKLPKLPEAAIKCLGYAD